ncbi:glycosyltransferase [Haloterrigena sp. SYSU A558-1]|uniref:Glycosyltransferase n=1 Tax=Haloterrigena gelatinilytica TaxID=2741724 RepID=A0ABX2LKW5_9EURY|nr:glycosyltransferase [Haloterrigena gelatinilytica]NUC75063.1 glycosyltransferase [Haloterrigena gelatinilytica]
MTDTVIAHKDYDVRGGGERLAEELSRTFEAPLVVGRRDAANEPDDLESKLEEIDYGPIPDRLAKRMIDRGGAARSIAYQLSWQQQDRLTEYETVITSGNEPMWYVPEDDQTVVAYTHSTPRWQYDLFHDVDSSGLLGPLSVGYNYVSRVLYQHNVTRPDLFVANSDLVARRIRQYWNIPEDQIKVVYPPVRTHEYAPDDAHTEGFYFHLGRLAEHKRVDDLIRTFNQLDSSHQLKIAGKGPDRKRLEKLAGDNIEFLGYVSESEKQRLMAAAKAHVYPALNEDFGMVPVESMAAGTPVIGVNEGFTQYQIMGGANGYTFEREGNDLWMTIRRFEREGVSWSEDRIAEFAERFSVEQFRTGMREAVAEAEERSRVTTPWERETEPTTPESTPEPLRADGGASE